MLAEPTGLRFTVEQFDHMAEIGLFPPDLRVELLGGEVFDASPIGSRRAAMVDRLTSLFIQGLGEPAMVRVQHPVRLSDISEPAPDLTLLRQRTDAYRDAHPTPEDVFLVVEVSDSTARWDRAVKRPIYAAAGITEMWIVDLAASLIEVATDPGADGYGSVQALAEDTITPLAFPDIRLDIAELFA